MIRADGPPDGEDQISFYKERAMLSGHGGHWLERKDVGRVTVVRLKVQRLLDDEVTQDLFRQIYSLVDLGRRNLVLDLGAVEQLASVALGKLVMLNRKAQAADGRLALCALTPAVLAALEPTHLADRFGIYPDEEAALLTFPSQA
jgi:anti-sigma B factor antagonist